MESFDSESIVAEGLPPQSYLFFIVAKVGPSGSHRPVAVALCQGNYGTQSGIHGRNITRYCLQTIAVLSDPGNRIAIHAELGLAADFYKNDTEGVLLPRIKLPELSRWSGHPNEMLKRMRVWDQSLIQFPIIATCLQVGIGYNPTNGSEDAVKKEALGTVYYDDSLEYGMVVMDISDLGDVRYGIIGLSIRAAQQAFGTVEQKGLPPLEKHVRRRPLSAIEFMSEFYPNRTGDPFYFGDIVNSLQEYPLIAISAMDCKLKFLFYTLIIKVVLWLTCICFLKLFGLPMTMKVRSPQFKPHSHSTVTTRLLVMKPFQV